MYFTKTRSARFTFNAALFTALLTSVPAFATEADEVTLTNNEHAAQRAIVYPIVHGGHASSEAAPATLAYNEDAAQRAITNASGDSDIANFRADPVSSAVSRATLMHNELSAQHAIVDTQVFSPFSDAHRANAALNVSISSQSAVPR